MYEEEPRNSIPFFSILGALIFSFGSLWVGTYAAHMAFYGGESSNLGIRSDNQAAVFDSTTFIHKSVSTIEIPSPSTTIMIGGDVMLDRRVRLMGQKNGYDSLFSSITPLFKTADIVIVNLEGPVTAYPSKTLLPDGTLTKEMAFTFAPGSTKALANAGITAVSLANNHEDNFGVKGVVETKQWLAQSDLKWFGSPWNASSTELVMEKNGMKIAFVGYHAFQSGLSRVLSDVKRLTSEGNFVIVMPHWGEEYTSSPSKAMREQARSMISAGAKAIIGGHPHVIMNNETIAGVPVYYSIGNLLFDQYFSPEVTKGQIVSLKLVNGPAGPSLNNLEVYNTELDRNKGVIVK
ncbi:MAG: CapA family protein [Candidatus Taylorbacteria bacterium]